jgi:Fungal cellulose binding domain
VPACTLGGWRWRTLANSIATPWHALHVVSFLLARLDTKRTVQVTSPISAVLAVLTAVVILFASLATATDCGTAPSAGRYEQCGGRNWKGPTCCRSYNTCVAQPGNIYYSQCLPSGVPRGIVPWWGQCGGQGYTGAKTCEPESECTVGNRYYSKCVPTSPLAG